MKRLNRVVAVALTTFLGAGASAWGGQAEPPHDPFRAHKNVEIGMYYFKKKNYDAAIERFKEAIVAMPKLALPYRLLGEACEKKGEKAEAIRYYGQYLEVLPAAEDAAKVRERIAKLERQLEKEAARRQRRSKGP